MLHDGSVKVVVIKFLSMKAVLIFVLVIDFAIEETTPVFAKRPSDVARSSFSQQQPRTICEASNGDRRTKNRIKRYQAGHYTSRHCKGRDNFETPAVECSIQGMVSDASNIPLSGVEVVSGLDVVARTNENGFFSIRGVCEALKAADLVARKLNYIPQNLRIANSNMRVATAKVKLLREVKPTILRHPVSKTRSVGQRVKFCCVARGNRKDHIYFWYHNDNLIDPSLYSRDPGSIEIRNLTTEDSGNYKCKVKLQHSYRNTADMSQTAVLLVVASEEDVCLFTPLLNLVFVPSECGADARVRQVNNKTYVDAGKCSNQICPNANAKNGETCDAKVGEMTSCCGPTEREKWTLQCGEFTVPVYRVTKCGCTYCFEPAIRVRGRVHGEDENDPLRYGFVKLAGKRVAITSFDGTFSVEVPKEKRRLPFSFEDRFGKFMTTTKILNFKENGGSTNHDIMMKHRDSDKIINSNEKLISMLNGIDEQDPVAMIMTPAHSFFNENGQPYTGKVKASITFVDPRNESSYEESPSDLSFADENGALSPSLTYGMFELSYRDQDSNKLNVGKVKVVLNKNQLISDKHAKNLKIWSLNEEIGMWEEEEGFQEMKLNYGDLEPDKKRKKREVQTFLVGNVEVRERRLYNLNVPVENRCWMKVRTFRSPRFDFDQQLEGVEVTAINMKPADGFRRNSHAWGQFYSELTTKQGACLRVLCHVDRPDAYNAVVTAKLDGSEELYAAPSNFPLDPEIVGIRGDILKTLEYRRSDHSDVSGKKTSFRTNLPRPKPNGNLTGPIYPEKNYSACAQAPITDNHFRFYRTEDFLYEYNAVFMDEHNCITWTPHYMNWWPDPFEFTACYIKVHIHSFSPTIVRIKSFGGTHPETKDQLYGIRDDSSVMDGSGNVKFTTSSAACVQYKCSGFLYDKNLPDRTLLSIVPQGECWLQRINTRLSSYLANHSPTVASDSTHEFRLYAPDDHLDHKYGIYVATDDDPLMAKKSALDQCFAGHSGATARVMNAAKGVAVYYRCRDRNKEDDEMP